MPTTEAQRNALRRWKERNPGKMKEYNKKWREGNEEYRIKQISYTIRYQRRKKAFQEECQRLCQILIE